MCAAGQSGNLAAISSNVGDWVQVYGARMYAGGKSEVERISNTPGLGVCLEPNHRECR